MLEVGKILVKFFSRKIFCLYTHKHKWQESHLILKEKLHS